MKQIVTDMPGFRQLTDEELETVCGAFNPQPDPPARQEIWSNTLVSSTLPLSLSTMLISK